MEKELKNLNNAVKYLAMLTFIQGRLITLLLERCHMEEHDRIVLQALNRMQETFLELSHVGKVLQEKEMKTLASELVHLSRRILSQYLRENPEKQLEEDLILAHFEEVVKKFFS